jgi:hypothetical protein
MSGCRPIRILGQKQDRPALSFGTFDQALR